MNKNPLHAISARQKCTMYGIVWERFSFKLNISSNNTIRVSKALNENFV